MIQETKWEKKRFQNICGHRIFKKDWHLIWLKDTVDDLATLEMRLKERWREKHTRRKEIGEHLWNLKITQESSVILRTDQPITDLRRLVNTEGHQKKISQWKGEYEMTPEIFQFFQGRGAKHLQLFDELTNVQLGVKRSGQGVNDAHHNRPVSSRTRQRRHSGQRSSHQWRPICSHTHTLPVQETHLATWPHL